jgi:hypothetical protein
LMYLLYDAVKQTIIYTSSYKAPVSYDKVNDTIIYDYRNNIIYNNDFYTFGGHWTRIHFHTP